jgi:hypothetical protein
VLLRLQQFVLQQAELSQFRAPFFIQDTQSRSITMKARG